LDSPPTLPAATTSEPLQLIVGDFGVGKSLLAEKLHLAAIAVARVDTAAPVPVLLDATNLQDTDIQKTVEHQAASIGSVRTSGVHLVIDGLDEIGTTRAFAVLAKARVLARTWPGSTIRLFVRVRRTAS